MRILLLVLGLLALASGGLKFRDRIRTRIGTSPFSLGELGLGALAGFMAIKSGDPTPVHSGVAGLTVIAMIFAGIHQSRLAAAFQHRRDISEAHRLRQYVEIANPGTSGTPPRSREEMAAPADKLAVRTAQTQQAAAGPTPNTARPTVTRAPAGKPAAPAVSKPAAKQPGNAARAPRPATRPAQPGARPPAPNARPQRPPHRKPDET